MVVESGDATAIARALGVERTGSKGTQSRGSLAGRPLGGDRYLLLAYSSGHPAFARRKLEALARFASFTFCGLEEHVMWSSAQRWEDGREAWSAAHHGEESVFDLRTNGELPVEFAALERAARERQAAEGGATAGVDLFFDLPIDLAHRFAGLEVDDAVFDADGFERLDGGWRERLSAMPLWAKGVIFILALYALAYVAGAVYRALSASGGRAT